MRGKAVLVALVDITTYNHTLIIPIETTTICQTVLYCYLHRSIYFLLFKASSLPTHSQPHQHITSHNINCPTMAPHAENVTGVASDGKEVPVNPGEAPLEPGIKKNIAQGQMVAFPT